MLSAALLAGLALLAPRAYADAGVPPAILFVQADRAEDAFARELEAALDAASSSTVHLILRCGAPRDLRGIGSCLEAFHPRLIVAAREPEPAVSRRLSAKGATILVVPAAAKDAARETLSRSPDPAVSAPTPSTRAAGLKRVAAAHFDIGDDAGAKAALLRALAAAPGDFDALDLLYRLELRGAWLRDADTYADREAGLKDLSPDQRATALEHRARTRALLGDDDAAIKDLREALRLRPDGGEAAYRLAQLLRDSPREALDFAERAGKSAARRAPPALLEAEIRLDLGDAAGARKVLDGRTDVDALQILVHAAHDRPDEARAAAALADKAASASPPWEQPAALRLSAALWRELKDPQKALASLKRALAAAPNDVYTLEAMVDLKRDRPNDGLDFAAPPSAAPAAESAWTGEAIERALEADREDIDALGRLVELERGRGNVPGELRAAARFLDAAREAAPWRQPGAYRYITGIWLELGDDNNVQIALGLARDLDRRSLEFEELSRNARRPDARGVIYAANRVAAHVAIAAARAELGDAAEAERHANLALAEDPAALPALQFMSRFDLERGRSKEALAFADRLVAASEGASTFERADAARLRAEIEFALGEGVAAAKDLDRALALFPDDLDSLQKKVDVEEKAGRFKEALEPAGRLTAAVQKAPPARRAAALTQEARIRIELKDEAGAAKKLDEALALDPASPDALRLLTGLRLARSEKKEALEASGKLVEASARALPVESAQALRLRAKVQLAAGDIPGARQSLESALALDPSRAALSAQIQFELEQRRPEGAAAYADRLFAADAAAGSAVRAADERQKAQIQLELGIRDAAADCLRRALSLDPSDREAARLLINVELSRDRPREALAAADRLVAASSSADAFRQRARLRLELGDAAGARADFARALELAPDDLASLWALMRESPRRSMDLVKKHRPGAASRQAPWRVLRGMASSFGGDAASARADFEAAVAADSATVCFGEISRENRDRFDPSFFDSCLKAFPAAAALYSDRGVARYRAGMTDAAIADFREAVARAPDLLEARLSLATALAAAGRRDEAAKEADLALARKSGRSDPVVEQLAALRDSLR